ncbi:MAG: xanthine dehydrogenase family protein molybdopterin-binding subunit [Burkholderiales bacterium]|nr:xanthine dehydrogenase family protein molybdopterin-binding subunit [Burkholderiales bacterium]
MKRRHFALGAAGLVGAAGALVVGWSILPPRQRLQGSAPLPTAPGQAAFNGWVKIGADDRVAIVMPKSEMGQGTHTGLAMLLADELDADWSRVDLAAAPIDAIYNDLTTVVDGLPFPPDDHGALARLAAWMTAKTMREVGIMVTGGSSSLRDLWLPMRQAGASARAMLVAAAAQAWDVPVAEVTLADGVLAHRSGRQARLGEFAAAAATLPLPEAPVLKTPAQFKLIGRPLPRLAAEATAKGLGRAGFGIDMLPPGLLYASVRMCPTLGGRVASFDAGAALKLPGVKQALALAAHGGGSAGVAVIADTPWHAMQGVAALAVRWDEAVPAATFSSDAAMDQLARTLDHDAGAYTFLRVGDVDAALAAAPRRVEAEYRVPYLAHLAMEPINCTVQFKDGRATVWAPTQVPGLARRAAARVLGVDADAVDVQVTYLGGGFGRRLESDFVAQAAEIARAAGGAPVQTLWPRDQDVRHDFYRPAAVARLTAGLDGAGRVLGWRSLSAGQAIVPQVLARSFGLPGVGPDKTTAEGAFDQAYEWPAARVAHAAVELPVPVGFWRSVGHSYQAFFVESFVDELAHAAGQDPLAFRLALLARHPRHRAVLLEAAALAGWGQPGAPAPDGAKTARGLALHESFGSIVAQVAEVSATEDGTIRVHRVACAIDCGTPVNPNLIRQQMESAVVFGLSAALYGGVTIARGQVLQSNFHDQPALRMGTCPVIETRVLPGTVPPEGVGEPGTPPIAPAVANALFALTGQRLRSLPLKLKLA